MEVLVPLLLIVVIALIVSLRGATLKRIKALEEELLRLRTDLTRPGSTATTITTAPVKTPEAPKPPVSSTPKETEPFTPAARPQPGPAAAAGPEIAQPHVFPVRSAADAKTPGPRPAPAPAPVPGPGFFERHPDLEKFIGENLISKIGIAILVLAIGYFVKYAIDNDWIGPVGRVGIGIFFGGILVGIAHWLRNSYKAFSSVLVGGGLAIFYFTISLAYHQYALFGQTTAFVIMLVITAFAVILALLYDRQELAIIALVGGFVAPFLSSNGTGNYQILFTYLLILNGGLLVMAYNKSWRLLNALAFGFTVILFLSWLISLPDRTTAATYHGGFVFASIFYILFFAINIAHNIRENKKFIASDFGILLANTCLYFGAGLYLIAQMKLMRYQGLFSAVMAVFNLTTTWILFRTKKVDSNILYLLIGITLTFISLTAPIQLHGHYITLFWASETVLLYWLFQRSGIRLIRLASLGIGAAMLVSLIMDWLNAYTDLHWVPSTHAPAVLPIIFNKGFLTGLYSAGCCFALARLCKEKILVTIAALVGAALLYLSGALEIAYQFDHAYVDTNLSSIYLLLYTYVFLFLFATLSTRAKNLHLPVLTAVLLGVCLLIYLMAIPSTFELHARMLAGLAPARYFIAHWVADLFILLIIARLIHWERTGKILLDAGLFTWLAAIMLVIFLSIEGQLLVDTLFFAKDHSLDELQRVYVKTGLPILWGICSFVFMSLGMRFKFKTLRIVSLFLFSLTLLKLFLFDIQNIPVAGKIAAFFCLGVLLLVVSFMYQRLKKIIIEDEDKKSA